jgi:hypothetical protein
VPQAHRLADNRQPEMRTSPQQGGARIPTAEHSIADVRSMRTRRRRQCIMGRVTSSKPAMLAAGIAGVAGQILFTLGWFMAGVFQGDAYSVVRHDISDMGALGAPYPWLLLIPQSIAGACTIIFGVVGFRPALVGTRGRTLATTLLVLPLGVGNLVSPAFRLDCRVADGCTVEETVRSWHATVHSILGILLLVAAVAPFVVARCLRRSPQWARLSRTSTWFGVAIAVAMVAAIILGESAVGGLAQRIFALLAATWVAVLAGWLLRLLAGRKGQNTALGPVATSPDLV